MLDCIIVFFWFLNVKIGMVDLVVSVGLDIFREMFLNVKVCMSIIKWDKRLYR